MADVETGIAATGFSEVGSQGCSLSHRETEAQSRFTLASCIEIAWAVVYIKHFDGHRKDGFLYVSWLDAKSAEPALYEKDIFAHTGVHTIGVYCLYCHDFLALTSAS